LNLPIATNRTHSSGARVDQVWAGVKELGISLATGSRQSATLTHAAMAPLFRSYRWPPAADIRAAGPHLGERLYSSNGEAVRNDWDGREAAGIRWCRTSA
jgi:hypothetical protein